MTEPFPKFLSIFFRASSKAFCLLSFKLAIILLFLDNFPFQAIGIPVADIMLYLCLVFTIYSGVDYFIKNKHVFVGSM
jgi:phosphatidylglycerophosphate synthase